MEPLIEIKTSEQIPQQYLDTPIALFLEYHNLERKFKKHNNPELLIGMCIDSRQILQLPHNFAYVVRTGGGNMRDMEFNISYAVAVGGIKHIIVLGHTNCAMINLMSKKNDFIRGLVDSGGWEKYLAEEHFFESEPIYEIKNEIDFVLKETRRLRLKYPAVTVVPMIYRVKNNLIYIIEE